MSSDFYSICGGGGSSATNSNSGTTSAAACSSSRWLTEEVFKLIDIVQRDEAIYNPRHKYYFCRPYVENFWREVDLKLEKNPGASLAKWTNLRISFRREYTNYVEEKVPPCWSYFDRMFFLHPYLRKKHQQPKSLDSQVQDALVQISSLSNRLQRERVAAAAAASAVAGINVHNGSRSGALHANRGDSANSNYFADSYLDYFEDDAPNNSELDEIIDDEQHEQQHARFQSLDGRSLNNDIKSECEETRDDYEEQQLANNRMTPLQDEDPEVEDDQDIVHNFVLDSLPAARDEKRKILMQSSQQQQQQQQHLQRLQVQRSSYHEDMDLQPAFEHKRPRSEESIDSSAQAASSASSIAVATQRLINSSTPAHTNVSFVRPTFTKPMDMVSTTCGGSQAANAVSATSESDASTSAGLISSSLHPRHQHRSAELLAGSSADRIERAERTDRADRTSHYDLCDCKTDPDAMFLMSLLPDIQKLNGRDRGKIKIAFQNILQDFLYPD